MDSEAAMKIADVRIARASMPMDYDDTESFRSRGLGVGEKLVVPMPANGAPPRSLFMLLSLDLPTQTKIESSNSTSCDDCHWNR